MMLEHLGWKEAALLIEKALENSFMEGRATADLARFMQGGVSLSTSAFTREIVERIENNKNIHNYEEGIFDLQAL